MSPDSTSSIFPNRPILPLPRRRLRERLSPHVAESIKYPPAPQITAPLFVYPYNSRDEPGILNLGASYSAANNDIAGRALEFSTQRAFTSADPRDETTPSQQRRTLTVRTSPDAAGLAPRLQQRSGGSRHIPQAPPSTASSADGYDSFENSNNKKKRKIPTAGESILNNNTHALSDSAVFGVPSPPTTSDEGSSESAATATASYYQTGAAAANGAGISGPGRGRYGRVRNGRSPLRVLSDPNSVWPGRGTKLKTPSQYPSSPPGENVGIISSAIASAERSPRPQGQKSVSLLQQRPYTIARNTPSAPTQFTFTFDSHNPVSWPGSDPTPGAFPGYHQTLPRSMAGDHANAQGAPATSSNTFFGGHGQVNQGVAGAGKPGASPNGTPKKTKKRGNSLLLAARRRKQQTENQNYHHPPKPEDMWMCEFCEYESIFGQPPLALIRQYEIKDRKRRREEAERRRLLEKAKTKSRKGKKAPKTPTKNSTSTPDHAPEPVPHGQPTPHSHQDGAANVSSKEYDNAYYEDDIADGDLPPLESFTRAPSSHLHSEHLLGGGGGGRPNVLPRSIHTSA